MSETRPRDDVLPGGGDVQMAGAGIAAPSEAPPGGPPQLAAGGVTAWVNNTRVNALWCINENRNSWIGIAGVGWKKLADNADTATVALTILGAHAKQTQCVVNYREEADGRIHEIYVW